MKRSYNSLTSLTSLTSINSRTKIYNNRDFQKYIENIEEDLIKISKNIDDKINKLFIDLRYRESDFIRLNNKIEYIIKDFNKYKFNTNYFYITNNDLKIIDNNFLYIHIFLYFYTTLIIINFFLYYNIYEI